DLASLVLGERYLSLGEEPHLFVFLLHALFYDALVVVVPDAATLGTEDRPCSGLLLEHEESATLVQRTSLQVPQIATQRCFRHHRQNYRIGLRVAGLEF